MNQRLEVPHDGGHRHQGKVALLKGGFQTLRHKGLDFHKRAGVRRSGSGWIGHGSGDAIFVPVRK